MILVIDDEESMRDSCKQILVKDGYRVETASDGKTGLEKIRELRSELVLIDLKMPGLSGMEVLEKTREIDPNIISVVITDYATVESAVEAMKRGAYDFLPKPFTPDELRIIIRRGLERRKLILEASKLREEKRKIEEHFITMVTHQLRSPLVTVQQYFEAILGLMPGETSIKIREMIKRSRDRINGLLRLIDDWLNMARIDSGELATKFKPLNLRPILSEIVTFMQPLANEKRVTIEIQPSDNLPMIQGDKDTLEQVFINLITNAINYNRPEGKVIISIKEEADYLSVEVADTGIGIPNEALPFIFDQFYRVKRDGNEKVSGSGLGLSIAKKIVDAHSGSIKVTTVLGEGSTFIVSLPKIK